MISRQKVQAMYQSGAKHYDFTTILFRLIGLRTKAYRLRAIKKIPLITRSLMTSSFFALINLFKQYQLSYEVIFKTIPNPSP
jgi:hypothetical protein